MNLPVFAMLLALSASPPDVQPKNFSAAECAQMRKELMRTTRWRMPMGATEDLVEDTDPDTVDFVVLTDEHASSHVSEDGQIIYVARSVLNDPARVQERQGYAKLSLERRLQRKYGGSCEEHPLPK